MIKAIFFDIDGTLVSMDTHRIPDDAYEALFKLKEKGIKLFIASGRPPIQLPLIGEQFNAFEFDGYVLLNGQYCMDHNKEVFHKMPIDKETLHTVVPYIKSHPDMICTFMELDYSYDTTFNPSFVEYLKSIGKEDMITPVDDPERSYTHDTYQICPYGPPEMDEEFLSHAKGMKSARWTPQFADMIPINGGKQVGIQKMLDRYGIQKEECMAFGDGGNDISMLEYVEIGVAMGNALPNVKAAADYVTDAIDDGGLVKAFKHFELL